MNSGPIDNEPSPLPSELRSFGPNVDLINEALNPQNRWNSQKNCNLIIGNLFIGTKLCYTMYSAGQSDVVFVPSSVSMI